MIRQCYLVGWNWGPIIEPIFSLVLLNTFPHCGNTSLTLHRQVSLDIEEKQTNQCQLSEKSSTLVDLCYGPWQKNSSMFHMLRLPLYHFTFCPSGLCNRVHFRFLFNIWKAQFQRLGFLHPCQYHRLKCDMGTWLYTFFKPEPVILQNVRGGTLSSHTLKWKVCWCNPISSLQRSPCNVAQWW